METIPYKDRPRHEIASEAKVETFDGYQHEAVKLANGQLKGESQLSVAALGLCSEAGEVADLIKKHIGQGHVLDRDKLVEEIGDVVWYLAYLCHVIGVSFSYVVLVNMRKLWKRYPKGFTVERSLNRE